jgi:hypothetical protein
MKKIIIVTFSLAVWVSSLFGQARQEIVVKKIEVDLSPAPNYTVNSQSVPSSSNPRQDSSRKWLVIQAELESQPEWADEVQVKFYVAANYGGGAKDAPPDRFDVLGGTVTIVNVERNSGTGKKNIVPVFMDANTVKRYGEPSITKFIPEVAVQVYYKGVLQHTKFFKGGDNSPRFWETKPPKGGILLNISQSPWSPAFLEYFQQVKPLTIPSF